MKERPTKEQCRKDEQRQQYVKKYNNVLYKKTCQHIKHNGTEEPMPALIDISLFLKTGRHLYIVGPFNIFFHLLCFVHSDLSNKDIGDLNTYNKPLAKIITNHNKKISGRCP